MDRKKALSIPNGADRPMTENGRKNVQSMRDRRGIRQLSAMPSPDFDRLTDTAMDPCLNGLDDLLKRQA